MSCGIRLLNILKNSSICSRQARLTMDADPPKYPQIQTEFTPNPEVPGLSSKIVRIPEGEVGPGAAKTGEYKNVEYFCYNSMSFYDANIELMEFRMPQPSALEQ